MQTEFLKRFSSDRALEVKISVRRSLNTKFISSSFLKALSSASSYHPVVGDFNTSSCLKPIWNHLRDEIASIFDEMDLEGEGKLTFLQVMGGEESPLENLFRSMDKSSSGSITKEASGVMSVSVICSTSRQSQPVSRDQIYASDILPPLSV